MLLQTYRSPSHRFPPSGGRSAQAPALPRRWQSHPRILLCEDHPLNSLMAAKLLDQLGYDVELASNGRTGLDMFYASTPYYYSVVLMDIQMPVMDGLTAANTIRALDRPDAASVPIVAMTSFDTPDAISNSARAGMNAHLAKPLDPATLIKTLNELLPEGTQG